MPGRRASVADFDEPQCAMRNGQFYGPEPHSAKAFGNWFKKRCREAGLGEISVHGLRKLGAQRCAEAGATEHQLMALFGWANPQQAAVDRQEGQPGQARSLGDTAARSTKKQQKCPTFSRGFVRWDTQAEKRLDYQRSSKVVASPRGFEPLLPP
jgi:hypothetical protein